MKKLTPMKAIRQKCLDCCNGQMKEVRLCAVKNCPLFSFRNGKRPKGEEFVIKDISIEKSRARFTFFTAERNVKGNGPHN